MFELVMRQLEAVNMVRCCQCCSGVTADRIRRVQPPFHLKELSFVGSFCVSLGSVVG